MLRLSSLLFRRTDAAVGVCVPGVLFVVPFLWAPHETLRVLLTRAALALLSLIWSVGMLPVHLGSCSSASVASAGSLRLLRLRFDCGAADLRLT